MNWEECEESKLVLRCFLTPGMPEYTQKARHWACNAQQALAAEIQHKFLKKEIQMLQEVFQVVINSGKLQDLLNNASSEIKIDPDAFCLTFWGFEPDVQKDYIQCEALVDEVQIKVERGRDLVSDSLQLHPFRCVFLKDTNFQAAVNAKYPQLNVSVCVSEVKFHGMAEDITSAKLFLFEEFLNKQVTTEYQLPPVALNLLKTNQMRDVVLGLFKDANIRVVWDVEKNNIKASALSQADVDKGIEILQKQIVQTRVIHYDEESTLHEVLKLTQWQETKQQLETRYDGLLMISQNSGDLDITCLAGICDIVKGEIHNFLTDTVVLEHLFSMEVLMAAEAVDKLCKDELRKIVEKWQTFHCDIILSQDPDKPGFVIKATKPGMANILKDVETQVAKLETQVHIVEAGGQAKFFQSSQGKTNLDAIASKHKAVIFPVMMSSQVDHAPKGTTNQVSFCSHYHCTDMCI